MLASDFAAWVTLMRNTRKWTDAECARQLGCGENQIRRWKDRDPPRYIALACAALAFGLPEWRQV